VTTERRGVEALLRPRSIAIVGASDKPGGIATRILDNLERFSFSGEIHLVSRSRREIRGRACVGSIAELPADVDVALLTVPAEGLADAVDACVARDVHGAIAYASGFAEMGTEGVAQQERIAASARSGGLALLGPNCIGLTNYVDGVPLSFGNQRPRAVPAPALAVLGQSGGMVGAIRMAIEARALPVAYTIATGNEAVVRITDFLDLLIDDKTTRVIAIIAEEIREPRRFLSQAARAHAAGKSLLLLHPGRSEKAREAARSHTGAIATDFALMQTLVEREGVILLETLEEVADVGETLLRAPAPRNGGVAILTDSGAFKGMAADFCEKAGLRLATFSVETTAKLTARLPAFASSSNPVDVTAQGLSDPAIYGDCAEALLRDENVGALMLAMMPGGPEVSLQVARATLPKLAAATKPVQYVLFGEGSPVAPEVATELRAGHVTLSRSPERALRALAHVTRHGAVTGCLNHGRRVAQPAALQLPPAGKLSEYQSKALLGAAGFEIPPGGLARTLEGAQVIAARIGYPVVLKAQASDLPHKSDVGGVVLNVQDVAALERAWTRITESVAAARPDLKLDGLLVESMGARGLELIVSARRDPAWGVVLMVGAGGVWIEALGDVALLAPDLTESEMADALRGLRAAKLLDGWRGAPPADIAAITAALARLADVMLANPGIEEIEINPMMIYAPGDGAMVLDALMTIADPAGAPE
jgi:acyl-CoA synthetase (NDP forming)